MPSGPRRDRVLIDLMKPGNARPRCPIHHRLLICPACIGAAGGRVVTPARLRALRKARRALREKRRRPKAD